LPKQLRIAETAPSHHACGFCSAQFGLGIRSGYSVVADVVTSPVSETSKAFAPVVPMSTPKVYLMLLLLLLPVGVYILDKPLIES